MPLDPQIETILTMLRSMHAPALEDQTVEKARQSYAMLEQMAGGPPEPIFNSKSEHPASQGIRSSSCP